MEGNFRSSYRIGFRLWVGRLGRAQIGWESLSMNCNFDEVRGLACLFDPEGRGDGRASGSDR